jgi:hypothetical protein
VHTAGALSIVGLVGQSLGACGARTWLPAGESPDARVDDATSCVGTDVPLLPNVPNLYFVLDASGSMLQNSKWANVRSVVADLIRTLGESARFGATVFPRPGADACATGVEVMPLRLGDARGDTANIFLTATALVPQGGTPTAATFRSLLPALRDLPEPTYAILATDGGPNCDPALTSCSVDQCTSNLDDTLHRCPAGGPPNCCVTVAGPLGCLDGTATERAVADLRAAGVQTYVLGIPGSAPYAQLLDSLALAGGTARPSQPLYYRVDSADTGALGSGLAEIAAQAMKSCRLLLSRTPVDSTALNVYLNGAVVPSDGPNGWSVRGRAVTLEGAACAPIQSGAGTPTVAVLEGCATIR